jgi:putative ABC transport system permease protein
VNARLAPRELIAVAVQGIRTRRLRAALSALGIAIGIGAMVAVVGVSASSQANLLSTIDKLGTNLLTVSPGQTFLGANEALPSYALGASNHMAAVQGSAAVYQVSSATVRRTPYVPTEQTGGIGVDAASPNLLGTVGGELAAGSFLDSASERFPTVVLGAQAASTLQIENVGGHIQVFLGGTWFNVIGVLKPVILDPNLDSTAFIGLPVAERLFQTQPSASEIYVRANVDKVTQVSSLLAATADPENPGRRPRASSRRCCSASAPWPCSWERSGSRTSWSSRCSSAAARSGCAVRSAPPAGTSAPSSWPSRRCWPRSAVSPGCCSARWPHGGIRWRRTSRWSFRSMR